MRLSQQDSLTTNLTVEQALAAVQEVLGAADMKPRRLDGADVEGTRGSVVAMMFLGLLTGVDLMPVKVGVHVQDDGSQRTVNVTATENYITQAYLFYTPRMRKAVEKTLTEITVALRKRLVTASVPT